MDRAPQVLVDDAGGSDVGHLGPFGELVDDEGVQMLVVGHCDVQQEVLAAGNDEHADGVPAGALPSPGRPRCCAATAAGSGRRSGPGRACASRLGRRPAGRRGRPRAAVATGSGRAPWWGRRRPRRPDPGWSAVHHAAIRGEEPYQVRPGEPHCHASRIKYGRVDRELYPHLTFSYGDV